jgi:hypothetical protein
VVLEEVPLRTDVFSLLADQGFLGVRDGTLVVLLDSGGFGDGGVEDLPHKLTEMESLLGGVSRKVVLGFTSGLGHTSLLFRLVAYEPASEGEWVARTRLAGVAVVRPIRVGKASKLGECGPCLPPTSGACRWCHGGIGAPSSGLASERLWGMLGRSQGCSTPF